MKRDVTEFGRQVRASLGYIGRSVPWLAEQLGISPNSVYSRLGDDMWTLPQLKQMQSIFKWRTLEG